MNELALFAGAGGGILGGLLLGWRTVCAVEIDPYCRSVLLARQRDGILPRFPIWDDVRTFDGKPWRGLVDVISGGFPCQDIAAVGTGAGLDGERSGLWRDMARIIGDVRPRFAFVENATALAFRGLDRVVTDLAAMGFGSRWGVFSACSVGAPHTRERLFVVADANSELGQARVRSRHERPIQPWDDREMPANIRLESDADVRRVADGMAREMDRLHAVGNGQVPIVAALAWETLTGGTP